MRNSVQPYLARDRPPHKRPVITNGFARVIEVRDCSRALATVAGEQPQILVDDPARETRVEELVLLPGGAPDQLDQLLVDLRGERSALKALSAGALAADLTTDVLETGLGLGELCECLLQGQPAQCLFRDEQIFPLRRNRLYRGASGRGREEAISAIIDVVVASPREVNRRLPDDRRISVQTLAQPRLCGLVVELVFGHVPSSLVDGRNALRSRDPLLNGGHRCDASLNRLAKARFQAHRVASSDSRRQSVQAACHALQADRGLLNESQRRAVSGHPRAECAGDLGSAHRHEVPQHPERS